MESTLTPETVLVNGEPRTYGSAREAAEQAARWVGQAAAFGRRENGTWTFTVAHELTTWTVMGFDHQPTTEVAERVGAERVQLWSREQRHEAIRAAFPGRAA